MSNFWGSVQRWFRHALRYAQGRSTTVVAVACFATAPCPHARSLRSLLQARRRALSWLHMKFYEFSYKSRNYKFFCRKKRVLKNWNSPKIPTKIQPNSIFVGKYLNNPFDFKSLDQLNLVFFRQNLNIYSNLSEICI